MHKKILVLFSGVGHGHKKASENIARILQSEYEVDLVNLFDLEKGELVDKSSSLYLWMIRKMPGLWRFFYLNKIFLKCTLPFRTVVASSRSKKVLRLLNQKKYDLVISVHVNTSSIISYLKSKKLYSGKFAIMFTDWHLHEFWIFKNADLFLANIDEQKDQMVKLGYSEEKIAVCGTILPVSQNSKIQETDLRNIREKFGLSENEKVILVLGGAAGFGIRTKEIDTLLHFPAKIFVVCGTNKELFNSLQKFYGKQSRVKIFGYVDSMPEFYAVADLAITKPGGLTIAECLLHGIPPLIVDYIPGGEELNYKYLLKHKLVMPLPKNFEEMDQMVRHELETSEFAKSLKQNPYVSRLVTHGEEIKKALTKIL